MLSTADKIRRAFLIDWDKVDLNRHPNLIMEETGVSYPTVRKAQRDRGIDMKLKGGVPKGGGKFQQIDVRTLDLTLTDAALGEQLGCHHRTVQKMRLDAGILFAPRRKKV